MRPTNQRHDPPDTSSRTVVGQQQVTTSGPVTFETLEQATPSVSKHDPIFNPSISATIDK